MEESFELLSSMSPKLKKKVKNITQAKKQGASKLALRGYFRRSIGFDKLKSTKDTSFCLVQEENSSSSGTFDSDADKQQIVQSNDEHDVIEDSFVDTDKFNEIKKWISNIPTYYDRETNTVIDDSEDEVIVIEDSIIENEVEIPESPVDDKENKKIDKKDKDFSNDYDEDENDVDDESEHNISIDNFLENVNKKTGPNNSNLLFSEPRHIHKKTVQIIEPHTERKENPRLNLHKEIFSRAKNMQNLESPAYDPSRNQFVTRRKKLNFNEDKKQDLLNASETENILDKIYGKAWRSNAETVLTPLKHNEINTCTTNLNGTNNKQNLKAQKLKFDDENDCNIGNKERRLDLTKEILRKEENQIALSIVNKSNQALNNEDTKLSSDNDVHLRLSDLSKNQKNTEKKTDGSCNAECSDSDDSNIIFSTKKNRRRVFSTSSEESIKSVSTVDPEIELKRINDLLYNRFLNTEDKKTAKTKADTKTPKKKEPVKSKETILKAFPTPSASVQDSYPSFLASLSPNVKSSDVKLKYRPYKTNFKENKVKLTRKLFEYFNEHVFEKKLPEDTPLEWNERMRGTAGFCKCKKITRRTGKIERVVTIELASKILTSADRLRDTLIHEMCHAATFIVNEVSDGHGSFWQAWTQKAMKKFPELPPIKRCHEYNISTKYSYVCTNCNYTIGRHSKSLDIERKRCGYCYGKFEVFINKKKGGKEVKVAAKSTKQANGFALFVKENYGTVRSSATNHADAMRLLGQQFSALKVKK